MKKIFNDITEVLVWHTIEENEHANVHVYPVLAESGVVSVMSDKA